MEARGRGGGSCVQARGGQIRGGEGRGQKTRETREEKEEEGGKKERVGGEDIVHILYSMYINARKNKEISEIKIITVYNHCYSSFDM